MAKYIVKRVLISILVLLVATFLFYLIMRALPTSYVETLARQLSQTPGSKPYREWLEQLNATYGLDVGVFQGYVRWLGNAVRGDFGDSWYFTIPVTQKFAQSIWVSFTLGAVAFVLEMAIAVPLGILSARKQYSKTDYAVTVVALAGISLPSFFVATLLKYVFSIKLGWFDLYGMVGRYYPTLDAWGRFWDIAAHLVLPILTLTLVGMGSYMRHVRTNMLEVLNADYIRTARAKGLPENKVINKHAFRNTLIPIVTLVGMSIPGLFAGAIVTETLFKLDGVGYAGYQAIISGDIPFSMFYLTFLALMTLVGTLLADILYALVDPRVRVNK